MSAFSTSSLTVTGNSTGSLSLETCYHVVGDVIRVGQRFFGSAFRDTDTASVVELDASEVGSSRVILSAPVSKACETFCDSLGLRPTLAKCLKQAQDVFSNIVEVSVDVDYFRDVQAEDVPHVVIRVKVNSDQQTALQEYDQLVCWMASQMSPSDSQLFTITVRRV